jgi:hypothetical protein
LANYVKLLVVLTEMSGQADRHRPGDAPRETNGGTGRRRARRGVRLARLRQAALVAAGITSLFGCALIVARRCGVQSDGAAMMLQARAMDHGNLLLHGWLLSDVSFYTIELPEYMLVEAVRGMRTDVVPICAAITYTLLVVLAALVARGQERGRRGLARAAITIMVMLGPTVFAGSVLLNDPDHTGTAVPILLALLLVARAPLVDRALLRCLVPLAVAAVLGWALVADPLVLLVGIAPLVLVCGARSLWLLGVRRASLAAAWFELSLAGAGVAAAIASRELSRLITAGGFVVAPDSTRFVVASSVLPANITGTAEDFLGLFSADFFGARLDGWLVVTGVHLVFAGLVAGALVLVLRRFFRGGDAFGNGDVVSQLLAAAIVINLVAYALLYRDSGSTSREIAPVFALGGALAGRNLGDLVTARRLEPLLAIGAVAALAVLVPVLVTVKPAAPANLKVAGFLAEHRLWSGIAGYWQADSVTADSGGRVTMRAVRYYQQARALDLYPWETERSLLNPAVSQANFLVTTPAIPGAGGAGGAGVTTREAIAQFGRPARTYRYEGYAILVWPENLLAHLTIARTT